MLTNNKLCAANKTGPRVFMCGDVYGETGAAAAEVVLPELIRRAAIDFVIVNGENAAGGRGLTQEYARRLFAAGADVITGGNHIFDKREIFDYLNAERRLLRPVNYPEGAPGRGWGVFNKNGAEFVVINAQGREFMRAIDCPFAGVNAILTEIAEKKNQESGEPIICIDFHAESNQEKEAFALYFDGRAAAVCGTHTHVQTADERLLPKGTAYITDLGMTGAINSVIGGDPEAAVKRSTTQILYRLECAPPPAVLEGAIIEIADSSPRLASNIVRVRENS